MIKCEAEGRIIKELPSVNGITKSGKDWEKREFIMETDERHGTKMKFSVISFDGPVINAPSIGERVKVRFVVEAYEGKDGNWWNDTKAWQVLRI